MRVFTMLCLFVAFMLSSNHHLVAQSSGKVSGQTGGLPSLARSSSSLQKGSSKAADGKYELATFGGGCFWCIEAVFENVEGVIDVVSGYSGDPRREYANPTYQLVLSHRTRHAEVCQITFDPKVITYKDLLAIFWKVHDSTTKDRQGDDVGANYRSVIFTHSPDQQKEAQFYKRRLNEEKVYGNKKVLTEVEPIGAFYLAEEHHQDYFRKNPNNAYCQLHTVPKLATLRQLFKDKVKD